MTIFRKFNSPRPDMEIQDCIESAIRKSLSDLLATVDSQEVAGILAKSAHLELLKKKPVLTSAEVSELYGIPVATLATWRTRRIGPDYIKAEGSIFYKNSQVENWLSRCEVRISK